MTALRGSVLVVDDEAYVRDSLATVLQRRGFRVETASSVAEATAPDRLQGIDVVITDLRMADGNDGMAVLRHVVEREPGMPVLVLTAHGSVPSAVDAMKAGAYHYLLKPADPDELVLILERALGHSGMRRELEYLRGAARRPAGRRPLGSSRAWSEVMRLAELAAPADTSVLLLGETGTGKEEVAKFLHAQSGRAGGPYVSVNCAAIPTELFESEFFGHRKGAFTGALADREGRFRVAHRGSLFLDEINSLPPSAQAKVLRVLEDGTFERVGDSKPTAVDVRLICASNLDLEREAAAGRFRADLLYRINVLTIRLPPLSERRDDLPELAEHFLREFRGRLGKPVRAIHPAAGQALLSHAWPGNVRELRNVIERGVLLEAGEELTLESLPLAVRAGASMSVGAEEPAAAASLNLRESLAAAERRILQEALQHAEGVRHEAAGLLGIDARNLAYYLKKHGLMDWAPPEEGDGS